MRTRPLIAIPPQLELDPESYGARRRYARFIERVGGESAVLSPLESEEELLEALRHFDGLLLTGGADVTASLYGEETVEGSDAPQPERDAMEGALIRAAKELHMPFLGICRGLQIMNVTFGGTLHQRIAPEVSTIAHWQPEPYDAPSHGVHIQEGTILDGIFDGDTIQVNSMHHQAVEDVPAALTVAAKDDCGMVEALYDPTERFFLGIQWHPEYAPELKESVQVGRAFIAACKAYGAQRAALPKTANGAYTSEYLLDAQRLDPTGADRARTWDYLESSTSKYDGITVFSSYLPKLFDQVTYDSFKHISETTYSILCKVMEAYIASPSYRALFDYGPRLEELILLPCRYDKPLAMMRIDIFFNEDTLDARFCEFNSDGSSGMNENREITIGVQQGAPYAAFAKRHDVKDCVESLFEGWVDEFLAIYDTFENKVEHPTIAIVDFLDHAVVEEFKVYGRIFESLGYEFAVYDMRELSFQDGRLVGGKAYYGKDGMAIDAIWRRCISSDVVDHWEESQPLIEAVRAGSVALIGSFAGHIVHDKRIFSLLLHPETKRLLTAEENELLEAMIPYTALLDDAHISLARVKAERPQWVIKPLDSYGSQGVFVGLDYSDEEWSALVDQHANGAAGSDYLAQEFCFPYPSPAVPLYGKEADYAASPQVYKNLSGLYVYGGTFTGVFSRQGPRNIILGAKGGVTAPSLWVDVDMGTDAEGTR